MTTQSGRASDKWVKKYEITSDEITSDTKLLYRECRLVS